MKFTEKECQQLLIDSKNPKTVFKFYSSDDIEFEGAFSSIFNHDEELKNAIYYIEDNILNYFKVYGKYTTKKFIESIDEKLDRLLEIDSKIWVKYKKSLNEILEVLILQEQDMASREYNEECYTLIRHIETIKSKIKKKYKLLPVIYYRTKEEELQSIYNLDEIKSAIKTKKGLLYKFMVVTEAPLEEFIKAIESNDENERNKCINSIKEKVKYNIQKEFNYFYEEDENVKITKEKEDIISENVDKYSVIYFAIDRVLEGIICIYDPPRDEAKVVLNKLRSLGIKDIVMLTGDSENAAATTAKLLGINHYRSQVLPEDKASIVEEIKEKGKKVIMVGDGINDSPALSAADVSVAMKDSSDLAREVADITLLRPSLNDLITIRLLSQQMLDLIHRNYKLILLLNTTFMALGLSGVISPSATSVLHNGSTMLIGLDSTTSKNYEINESEIIDIE